MSDRVNDVPQLKTIGAQAAGAPTPAVFGEITTLTGASTLPNRPATTDSQSKVPGYFVFKFSGQITGNVTVTCPAATANNGYLPGDVVRVLVSPATKANFTMAVADAGGDPTVTAPAATVNSQGAYVDRQLNAAGTSWVLLGFGGF